MMRKMGRIVDGLVRAESDAIDSLKYFSDHGFFAEALPKGPGETHISSVFLDEPNDHFGLNVGAGDELAS